MTEAKFKLAASSAALLITGICTAIVFAAPIETTSMKITGAFSSVFIISAAAWKFPKKFYCMAMVFDIFAAALGSVINLYKTLGFYDCFVHFLSGILLADAGMIIVSYLFRKCDLKSNMLIKIPFAFFFSSACAGFWEIYEFTADTFINANMQGGNTNTMGDIVSGVLGAAAYSIISVIVYKKKSAP